MLNFKRLCLLLFLMKPLDAMLSLCDTPSGYLEVREGKNDNTFTCSGQVGGREVQWHLQYKASIHLGTCYSNTTCTSNFVPTFNLQRTADTASLIVDERSYNQKDVFYTTSVLCQTLLNNNKIDETRCPLDLISPPETSSCSLQITNTTWKLTGQCDVSKVRSARGRYYCLLYQNSQPNWTLLGKFNMSTTPKADSIYSTGNCQIGTSLPPQGNLTYTVVIVPGEVLVSPSFTGSYEIRRPSGSPTHNCPQYAHERLELRCYCNANDLGSPQGSVVWNDVNSSELKIDSVNRTMSGMNFTCNLMWNNTVVQTVTYSPIVNYSASVLSFKMANQEASTVEVSENTNVLVVCQADGRPLPSIRLLKVTDGDSQTLVEADSTQELVHSLTNVQCESAATYVCQSENIVKGRDERRMELTVTCAPKLNPANANDTYTTTFKGDLAALDFQMISRPTPDALSIFYIGSLPNDTSRRSVEAISAAQLQCKFLKSYIVLCTVILRNKANFSAGFYSAVFGNSLGNLSFTFEIKEQDQETTGTTGATGSSHSDITGPVVGGVVGAVVAIVVIVVVIIFIVRRKGGTEKAAAKSVETEGQALHEGKDNASENKDVYATVDKKNSKETSASSTTQSLSTDGAETIRDGKPKTTKAPGKDKKKRKGDKKPLAQEKTGSTGGVLSMSPLAQSEYENFGFDEKEGKKRKPAKETKRRNEEDLNYTTVVFANTASTPAPLPELESTEYAVIVPQVKPPE